MILPITLFVAYIVARCSNPVQGVCTRANTYPAMLLLRLAGFQAAHQSQCGSERTRCSPSATMQNLNMLTLRRFLCNPQQRYLQEEAQRSWSQKQKPISRPLATMKEVKVRHVCDPSHVSMFLLIFFRVAWKIQSLKYMYSCIHKAPNGRGFDLCR